jgi:hypothetical protein
MSKPEDLAKPEDLTKVSNEEIQELPHASAARGMETKPVVCQQLNAFPGMGGGKCFHSPNMDDRYIDDLGMNEIFYCAEGELVAAQLDEDGNDIEEVRAEEGEFILLPAGNDYVLRASGVASINVFFNAPQGGWDLEDSYDDDEVIEEITKFA